MNILNLILTLWTLFLSSWIKIDQLFISFIYSGSDGNYILLDDFSNGYDYFNKFFWIIRKTISTPCWISLTTSLSSVKYFMRITGNNKEEKNGLSWSYISKLKAPVLEAYNGSKGTKTKKIESISMPYKIEKGMPEFSPTSTNWIRHL